MKILLCMFLVISSFSFGKLQDGKYSVRTDRSIWFWYPYTEVTVKDGVVTSVAHDRVKTDGRLASQDDSYNNRMFKKTKMSPELYSKLIPENYFKAKGDLDKMDAIAGATDSLSHFKKQYEFLMKQEKPGNYIMKKSDL